MREHDDLPRPPGLCSRRGPPPSSRLRQSPRFPSLASHAGAAGQRRLQIRSEWEAEGLGYSFLKVASEPGPVYQLLLAHHRPADFNASLIAAHSRHLLDALQGRRGTSH